MSKVPKTHRASLGAVLYGYSGYGAVQSTGEQLVPDAGVPGPNSKHVSSSDIGPATGETDSDSMEDREFEACDDAEEETESILSMGRYRQKFRLYALVPFTVTILIPLLAWLPLIVRDTAQVPSSTRLGSALVLSAALWSLSHVLRVPIYNIATFLLTQPCSWCGLNLDPVVTLVPCLSYLLSVLLQESLRVGSFVILDIQIRGSDPWPNFKDPVFLEAYYLALGWAVAEVIAGITQGYDQLRVYEDLALDNGECEDPEGRGRSTYLENEQEYESPVTFRFPFLPQSFDRDGDRCNAVPLAQNGSPTELDGLLERRDVVDVNDALEDQLTRLINVRARTELEDVYGMAVTDIPIFISILQRIDSVLLSLGITLLLSDAYLTAPQTATSTTRHYHLPLSGVFCAITALHWMLSLLHSSVILPRIGVHTASYVGLMVSLGTVFSGLAVWGALS